MLWPSHDYVKFARIARTHGVGPVLVFWYDLLIRVMQRAHSQIVILTVYFLFAAMAGPSAFGRGSATATVSPPIVIGFVGGYVKHDNAIHSPVQLAAHLRSEYPSGVHIEVFENHRGTQARAQVLRLLDADHDGTLSAAEKRQARIIIYGHSWGASEALELARSLGKQSVPVLLTIQVDSIAKHGEDDSVVPANVRQAVNFYQPHGLLHGRSKIRAADPASTRIIGNFRLDYRNHPVECLRYPWWDRYVARPHTEIECDPVVWNQVESFIRSSLPAIAPSAAVKNVANQEGNKQP